ncbi:uncharacterized protein [Diadema antillarum]|uniref:uncharacterized protein n=1 Tax=Diadema antillarum TaxID=105358 RepID=UPI003A8BF84E
MTSQVYFFFHITVEHYVRGPVVEVEDLEGPFLHMGVRFGEVTTMKVRNGSKIRNLLTFATKKMKEDGSRSIIFTGVGQAVTKTVTCAEIMKRQMKNLHQINKAYFRRTEEIWEPKQDGLDKLRVNRQVPALAILLSKDPLEETEPGYQAPGSFEVKWTEDARKDKRRKNEQKKQSVARPHGGRQPGQQGDAKGEDSRGETQGSMGGKNRRKKRRGDTQQPKQRRTGGSKERRVGGAEGHGMGGGEGRDKGGEGQGKGGEGRGKGGEGRGKGGEGRDKGSEGQGKCGEGRGKGGEGHGKGGEGTPVANKMETD